MMPDPERLSAVGRSPLVRAGSRWLSFARTLSRGPRRALAAADTLAFIEALYGGRFKSVEGGALSLDKVYRTAGGGLHVSETRLRVSVHPRFDLRLLNVEVGRAGSRVFREATTTILLSHVGLSGREQTRAALHITNGAAAASLTVNTSNVFPAAAVNHLPVFGYVSARGQGARQSQATEPGRRTARVERVMRGDVTTGTGAETSRPSVAPAPPPPSLRLTSLDLRRHVVRATRQEFVSVLLNTYLPALASRGVSGARAAGALSAAPDLPSRLPAAWTYAEPLPRQVAGRGVETRREFRSTETLREHAPARDARPPLLHLLSHASLLSSLSETSLTLLAGGADINGRAAHPSSGRPPALSLQHLRTHAVPSGAHEAPATVKEPRVADQTPQHRHSFTREVLTSLHAFFERVQSTFDGITHASYPTVFTTLGFEPTLRRGSEQASARRRVDPGGVARGHANTRGLLAPAVVFVRHASAEFTREAPAQDAGARTQFEQTPGVFSTRSALAGLLSPAAAQALRLKGAGGKEGALRETRAARPEGMALELIRHRREEVLRLPQPGYVFTQPARSQLEERQVITKANREEIVEVVRKEVRTLAASANGAPAASRVDVAGLAEEVYSTLVRRLLVEKERLGRI